MLHYDQPSLRLIPGDGRAIGENVEKSICARRKTGHLSKLPGIPAMMVRWSWHLNRRSCGTRGVCMYTQRGLNVDAARVRSDRKMGHYFCRPQEEASLLTVKLDRKPGPPTETRGCIRWAQQAQVSRCIGHLCCLVAIVVVLPFI
jgi:hypothetical protein